MNIYITFLHQFFFSIAIIIVFYSYIKSFVFYVAPKLADFLKITKNHSVEMAKGVVELPLIVLLHIIFSMVLILLLATPIPVPEITLSKAILYLSLGSLLGIGLMGFSSLLCRAIIEILRHISKPYFPDDVKDWLIMTRSGWLRHYLHTIHILPLPLALLIVFTQICCEEMVFRCLFLQYFLPAGPWAALVASTILFMFMQVFHMPNWISNIFPLIGSMVIGVVNGVFYLKYFNIFPLMIAHFAFFVVAVL